MLRQWPARYRKDKSMVVLDRAVLAVVADHMDDMTTSGSRSKGGVFGEPAGGVGAERDVRSESKADLRQGCHHVSF